MALRDLLSAERPRSIDELRRLLARALADGPYTASPVDWRDEVLYFLLPDRFSDNREATRPLLTRAEIRRLRQTSTSRPDIQWNQWADSGKRWQGGTINGIRGRLAYLRGLGRQRDLGRADLQAAGARRQLSRLRHPGFPRRRSALRHARRSRRAGPRRARARDAHHPGHHRQSLGRQLGLRRARRAAGRRVQRAALLGTFPTSTATRTTQILPVGASRGATSISRA